MTAASLLTGFLWFALAFELTCLLWRAARWRQNGRSELGNMFNEEQAWLDTLLLYGLDRANVQYTDSHSGRTLHFRKYRYAEGDQGIVLAVPRTDANTDEHAILQACCDANGLTIDTEFLDDECRKPLYIVDCGDDAARAHELGTEVWTKIHGATRETPYQRHFGRMNIDNPRLNPFAWPHALSAIALPSAVVLAAGMPPDWTVPLGSQTLSGSTAGLVFFISYIVSWGLPAISQYGPHLFRSRLCGLYRSGSTLIRLTLPVAVLLVWAGV